MYQHNDTQMHSDQRRPEMPPEDEDYRLTAVRLTGVNPKNAIVKGHYSESRPLLRVVRAPGGFAFVEDRAR